MPEKPDKAFNEWSLKVFEELVSLNAKYHEINQDMNNKMSALRDIIDERYAMIEEKLEKISHVIDGNGSPGLKIRVDRLEISENRRSWLLRSAVVSSITAMMAVLVSWLKR